MMAGIAAARPGEPRRRHRGRGGGHRDASAATGSSASYVGHGIGRDMHEDPAVPNFRARDRGIRLEPGHCLAIEPMLTLGHEETALMPDALDRRDGRRVARGPLRAHVAVTADGPEILTRV